jgi:hypothetical protein
MHFWIAEREAEVGKPKIERKGPTEERWITQTTD